MTFREEDIFPYQVVNQEPSSEYVKTILMQWTMLQPSFAAHSDCTPNKDIHSSLNIETLSNMASLHQEASDSDGFIYAPVDFPSVFEQAMKDNEADDERVAARQAARLAQLENLVFKLFQPASSGMMKRVEELIMEELKAANVPREEKWSAANLRTKAAYLVDFRARDRLWGWPSSHDIKPTKPTFHVHLSRLIAGQGLTFISTNLFVPYTTQFHDFDRILQDETQLCYIRTDFNSAAVTPSASTPAATDSPGLNFTGTSHSKAAQTICPSALSTYSEFGTTWVRTAQPPSRAEKGYSVRDGPWRCRIGALQNTMADEAPVAINDEKSYDALVATVKEYNKQCPNNEHFLLVMHSKERAIWEKATEDKQLTHTESSKIDETLTTPDGEEEEVDFGESYYDWLCREKKI